MEKIDSLNSRLINIRSNMDTILACSKEGHAGLNAEEQAGYNKLEAEYQKLVGQFEDAAAAEIVKQHTAIAEMEEKYKELKELYVGIATRKLVPVGAKVVEIKASTTYEKVDFEKAKELFSIPQLTKAKAISISAAEPVRTALGMIDEAAVKSLFKIKSVTPSVTVRKA